MATKKVFQKKPRQVLFNKNVYGTKVKVHCWDYVADTEPKDNDVYVNHLSNHISTYNRLGPLEGKFPTSETHDMLEEIWGNKDPTYVFKPLVNFTSYPCTDTVGRNKLMEKANLAQLPQEYGVFDYRSIFKRDYRNPNPHVFKPLTIKSPTWLMNRIIRSDLTHNMGTAPAPGDYQCLDTHTPIHHIRELRGFRYQSFDPATCERSFPVLVPHIEEKK